MYVVVFLQWSQLGYRRRNLNCPLRSLCFRVWYSLISIIFTKLLLLSQFIIQSFCIYMPCIKWCWFGGVCHVLHDEEMYDWWEDIVYCMVFVCDVVDLCICFLFLAFLKFQLPMISLLKFFLSPFAPYERFSEFQDRGVHVGIFSKCNN